MYWLLFCQSKSVMAKCSLLLCILITPCVCLLLECTNTEYSQACWWAQADTAPGAEGCLQTRLSVIHKLGVFCTCAVGLCRYTIAEFAPGFQFSNLSKLNDFFFLDLFGWCYARISKEAEAGNFTGWLLGDKTWYPSAVEIKIPFRRKNPIQLLLPLSNSFHIKEICFSREISAAHHAPLHVFAFISVRPSSVASRKRELCSQSRCRDEQIALTLSALPLAGDDLEEITRSESFPSQGDDQSVSFCLQQNFCSLWGRTSALVTCDHE